MPIQNTKVSAKERRIFRYILADAWETTISQVDVIEGVENENVRCLYFVTPGLHANTIVDSCTVTISQDSKILLDNGISRKYLALDSQHHC